MAIADIQPNPDQPRKAMNPEALQELADSIRSIGIIQPVTLRQKADGKYEIIAGERRWRAAMQAGLTTLPAYIRTATDGDVMEMALIENIQREDLNPIEIALAYNNLVQSLGYTQEQVADKVGKKRATVTNYLRLLKLPAQIQLALRKGDIDQGHARALAGLGNPELQVKLFEEIQKENYTVHKVEEMVKDLNSGATVKGRTGRISNGARLPQEYEALKNHLSAFFGTKVQMTCSPKGKGRISIPFGSETDLAKIIALFDKIQK